jgi:N-acetylmuramoyl-L-alanine amidase
MSVLLCASAYGQFTIVIDPGHGGTFSGCVRDDLKEKDIVLDMAKHVAAYIQKHTNARVVLTRASDIHFNKILKHDLQKRADIAHHHKADLFVSLHINAKPDRRVRGYEIYVPYEETFAIKSYLCASVLHHEISQHHDTNFVGNGGGINAYDRGIRAAKLAVLNRTHCPSILVEWDYLTHPLIYRKLQTISYRKKYAEIIARGLVRYIKGHKV